MTMLQPPECTMLSRLQKHNAPLILMQVQAYLLLSLNKLASGLPDSHTKELTFNQLRVSKQTLFNLIVGAVASASVKLPEGAELIDTSFRTLK
jgi:hypothetical protein